MVNELISYKIVCSSPVKNILTHYDRGNNILLHLPLPNQVHKNYTSLFEVLIASEKTHNTKKKKKISQFKCM